MCNENGAVECVEAVRIVSESRPSMSQLTLPKRLDEIHQELKPKPDRIEELYKIRARRIEPVGLVYLWPLTG